MDWDFLEGTLLRIGFLVSWTRGVASLYRSASSAVTLFGRTGCHFQLSRSVRQGCPLAPYLFLFVARSMSYFLRAQSSQLQGLHLPIAGEQDFLDQEYADDTLLYALYTPGVLDTIKELLSGFCAASGAKVNWNKSFGIPVGSDEQPTWGIIDGFTWLQRGKSCGYLGFQVGLDISPQ